MGSVQSWRFPWKLCSPVDSLSKASHCETQTSKPLLLVSPHAKPARAGKLKESFAANMIGASFPPCKTVVKALPNYISSELTVVCWPAGSARHPCAQLPGMDSSQCVCDTECSGECGYSVQDLAEFTGLFSEMLIGKGKVIFHWKGIFVEISLL